MFVKENDKFVGIVTERDLTRKVLRGSLDPKTTQVKSIMSQPILSLEGDRPVTEAGQFMSQHKVRHLGVIENGEIVGVISVKDLVSFFANPRVRH